MASSTTIVPIVGGLVGAGVAAIYGRYKTGRWWTTREERKQQWSADRHSTRWWLLYGLFFALVTAVAGLIDQSLPWLIFETVVLGGAALFGFVQAWRSRQRES